MYFTSQNEYLLDMGIGLVAKCSYSTVHDIIITLPDLAVKRDQIGRCNGHTMVFNLGLIMFSRNYIYYFVFVFYN